MSAPDLETPRMIDDLIDRMVDGPLRPSELRTAMARLDATPDGWRRCALAFLEAQSWGDTMRQWNSQEDAEPPLRVVPSLTGTQLEFMQDALRTTSPRWRPRVAGGLLAAALIFLAFTLGWMGHGWRTPILPESVRVPDPVAAPVRPAIAVEALAESRVESGPEEPRVEMAADRTPRIQEVARLRIGSDAAHTAEVPILAGEGIDERWLREQPSAVSEWQRVLWERQGYQLEEQRDLIPVTLADGRRAAVPVDQVQVRYVGHDPL